MHYMDESHISLFLIQVFILLVLAKLLGALCQKGGIPPLAGEILAGILLGPTILGRSFPGFAESLFPQETIQVAMLDTVSWFGVLFLLLATGFEINVSTVWKQGKAALSVGVVGVLVPLAIGSAVFYWLPESCWGDNASRITFTLFLATAGSITAISIVAKVMHDMDILKSDVSSLSLSACAVNDVFGWIVFTIVLAGATQAELSVGGIGTAVIGILIFGGLCLTLGSKAVGLLTRRIKDSALPHPSTMLTFIACLGLLCGAVTDWLGIHAILGFFLAGVMAGNTSEISEHTRDTITHIVHAIFVPIFFASIGIKVDFLTGVNITVLVVFTAVAVGGKFMGAWSGARLAGVSKPDALSIGIAFTPGGAMEIIVGMLALELKLIQESVFVAIVFAALSSSVLVGPMLAWSLRRRTAVNVGDYLPHDAVLLHLQGEDRWAIARELCEQAAKYIPDLDTQQIYDAVEAREKLVGTGIGKGVAVPHARIANLKEPLIVFGRSHQGVDWDTFDGLLAHHIFLILTQEEEEGVQLQILAAIAKAMTHTKLPDALMEAYNEEVTHALLTRCLSEQDNPDAALEAMT